MSNKPDKLKEAIESIEKGIKDLYSSEDYIQYLKIMSKFHNYSWGNSILINWQDPEATYVAGYKAWQTKFKRNVKKGEKGIMILAPAPVKRTTTREKIDPDTKKPVLDGDGKPVIEEHEIIMPRFRAVYVFDVRQTEGEPLIIPKIATDLQGNLDNYNLMLESLKGVSPFPVSFKDLPNKNLHGYCHPKERQIVLNTGLSEIQNIKTLIHEITHADLHSEDAPTLGKEKLDRRTVEVQAESVAFVVCDHYGIDASRYSFGYIARWSRDKELTELKKSLDIIQHQAADLIDRIDSKYLELQQEQQRRQNEMLDTVRHDNDIDLDRVKTREQLGFKDNDSSIKEKMAAAKATAANQNQDKEYVPQDKDQGHRAQ